MMDLRAPGYGAFLLPRFTEKLMYNGDRSLSQKVLIVSSCRSNSEGLPLCTDESGSPFQNLKRRDILSIPTTLLAASFWKDGKAVASEFADMPALRGKDYGKSRMSYADYTITESGLQYKDLRSGTGSMPKVGETVVVDWDGYTIGYYGRIFEARNKAKGGSFEVIPAFEEAILTMNLGGIRRIIVPPELGYPDNDFNKAGPRPTTFSGQRALDFVLKNQGLIDKTLLFDIELLKIIPN